MSSSDAVMQRDGYQMPPTQEVDCPHEGQLERPVLFDSTGRNRRVTACMICGTVSVTDAIVEEPHPNDVRFVANVVAAIPEEALVWLALWPRHAWGVWNQDRGVYLPAGLRCANREELEAAERAALAASVGVGGDERLRRAGIPETPPPGSLPKNLESYAGIWHGLNLPADMPLEALIERAAVVTDFSSPYARQRLLARADLPEVLARLLRGKSDSARFRAGLALASELGLSEEAKAVAVAGVIERIRTGKHDERNLGPLLTTLYYLGPAAAEARPLLLMIAMKVKLRDYYLEKRIMQVRELIKPRDGGRR